MGKIDLGRGEVETDNGRSRDRIVRRRDVWWAKWRREERNQIRAMGEVEMEERQNRDWQPGGQEDQEEEEEEVEVGDEQHEQYE